MSDLAVFAVVVTIAFVVAFLASRRVAAGDRRFAGLAVAPLLLLVVWPIVTLTGDFATMGWLALPGLVLEIAILAIALWLVVQVTITGFESTSAAEFESRNLAEAAQGALGFYGLILVGAALALVGLLVVAISRAVAD